MPYQHTVAAVHDGMIWRRPGHLGAYIVVNTENDLVRFRYLHMNPKFMDRDNLLSGREVSQGEIIGKVGTWGDYESGTSYHIHFNIQVFSKLGWVWVNPYMTLVLAYERHDRRARHRAQAGRSGSAGAGKAAGDRAHESAAGRAWSSAAATETKSAGGTRPARPTHEKESAPAACPPPQCAASPFPPRLTA